MNTARLSDSACRVQNYLSDRGFDFRVQELPGSTRTAQEAADSVGCEVGQIAKSLVFEGASSHRAVLVIASGANRVDEALLEAVVAEPVLKADAGFVRSKTGFAIGGVPPLGHAEALTIFIDADLMAHPEIWAAAGTPQAVFKLTPQELQKITGGKVIRVK